MHSSFVDAKANVMYLPALSGFRVGRDQLKASFLLGESLVDLLFVFASRFNAFQLNEEEIALFCALILVGQGR